MLEVTDLSKHYAGVRAVDGISFTISRGCCFGLLGPNGAGKTTTVEMLEGILTPTSGTIRYKGAPLGKRFRQEAGIMFQHTALQEFIKVREVLSLFQRFYPHTRPIEELVEICALQEFLERDTRKISGGQRQRLLLALALINNPEVVFLDEPTTGLDPQSRRNLWEQVREIKAENKTLVLTTHYMEEAHELCDEIIIIDHGRIIEQGAPQNLLAAHFDNAVITLPKQSLPAGFQPDPGATLLPQNEHLEILSRDLNVSIRHLLDQGISLNQLEVRSPTLEDLFLELTGHQLRT
jgi:ABC-2 type transport system ATP-binding protein